MAVIYGHEYGQASTFIAWLAAMQAVRILRQAPVQASISQADTRNPLFANLARSLSLVAATAAALSGAPLAGIAACGCAGETLALLTSTLRLSRLSNVSAGICLRPALFSGLWLAGATACSSALSGQGPVQLTGACILGLAGFLGTSALAFSALRREGLLAVGSMRAGTRSALGNKRPPA